MLVTRNPGESELEFHRRLVYGKLVDKTLVDVDYAELSEPIYGTEWSSDNTRKAMYGSLKTLQLMDKEKEQAAATEVHKDILEDIEARRIEMQKERQRFFDQRVAFNRMIREQARSDELNDIIARAIQSGSLRELLYDASQERRVASGNDLLVSLNDIHFGANVDNYWRKYNSDICAAMLTAYLAKIREIADVHHSENCVIWANGDMISGICHRSIDVSNRENVIEQVMGVSEMIAQFISIMSPWFGTVRYVSVAGNHSRVTPNKDNDISAERLDDLIAWYLKARLQNFTNVEIDTSSRIDPTMYVVNVRGKNYVGVHGDYDPTPANIQTLQTMVGKPVYAVLMGHLHHGATNYVQGIRTVMTGSFLGMDDYAVNKRLYNEPEQTVCVCTDRGIECLYNVPFDRGSEG